MFLGDGKVKGLLQVVFQLHANPPWRDPTRFFSALRKVVPFDCITAFMTVDACTHKILPSPLTICDNTDEAPSVIRDYNDYFFQLKSPILARIMSREFCDFHLPNTVYANLPKNKAREFETDFWHKHKVQFAYSRYIKTPAGWMSTCVSRRAGASDFSEEEIRCLDLLSPHFELIVAQANASGPCLFLDRDGEVVCADFHAGGGAALPARLCRLIAGRMKLQGADPLQPLHMTVTENGHSYYFNVFPVGTGRCPLFKVIWTDVEKAPPIPLSVLHLFAHQHRLSPRERDMLVCVVEGKQAKEMATKLGLAIDTVKEYLGSLYRKVGVDGRGPLMVHLLSAAGLNRP